MNTLIMSKNNNMKIKELKTKLGITNTDIARMFGYSNLSSYQNSTRKAKLEQGMINLYKLIESKNEVLIAQAKQMELEQNHIIDKEDKASPTFIL